VLHCFYDPPDGDIEIHGMDITQEEVADFIALQHECCQVEQVEFAQIVAQLKSCRIYREINDRTVSRIREVYDMNTELSLMKLEKTDPIYVAMVEYIALCRGEGTAQKVALGLKLPV
jgi:hypothetical protein